MRVATDIGGTFTDLVCLEFDEKTGKPKGVKVAKSDTTPSNFEQGILDTIRKGNINLTAVNFFAHGTTVVINALTEKKGVKTALITTKGFRDVLEIARCNRPDLFNFNFVKQPPFVPRYLRFEVEERMTYKGEVDIKLNTQNLKEIIRFCEKENVKAIAICLLHAYKNPAHEIQILQELKTLNSSIELISSHQVTREWREYERTSTTVLSGYVLPIAKRYLNNLEEKLHDKGLKDAPYIMQSNGGITTINDVKSNPITMVESGPASGIFGAIALGKVINKKDLIVLDIGGTTAKCALVENGQVKITTNYKIEHSRTEAGYPIQTPVIDIVEIGNGGGSIAWVDQGGKMHVGPKSAGAMPGPAAYGRGGSKLTTTDANIITGRIHPNYFLGGDMNPDYESIEKAAEELSQSLNATTSEIAKGILRIANANMVNALKLISVNKGYDPRDFSLMVIGGGGAMHGADLARELQISEVIVPNNAGVFSAFGMLMSDIRRDYIRTNVLTISEMQKPLIMNIFSEMKNEAIENFKNDNYKSEETKFTYYVDLRYAGQEHYVKVLLNNFNNETPLESIINNFHKEHKKHYSFELDTTVELVNFHLVAEVEVEKPDFPKKQILGKSIEEAIFDTREVDFDDLGKHQTSFYHRDSLEPEMLIEGPAIIAEKATTTVVSPLYNVSIDIYGNILLTLKTKI
ncbi:N-methylhydantoinase A [Tenacibaculum sp. MAR_2009_124]|uniref:hydantoinase/oxoprolinase family protein n=1 Tax=Tenacibaculum sp. MAR_2009_124 TaxID=1250059 RepID=UPI00089AD41C|nr:hydantoinase/oxoprolinase family protein [Tenacibaculum sp. MAR_2009_124]SEC00681.1 N-methylhydantoinase A [Tenacibaculum sp. MAR_2009_124]